MTLAPTPTLKAAAAAQEPVEAPQSLAVDDDYDDPDADYPDDGSRALRESSREIDSETLTPISPLEESGLLGNWGDSDDEAED